MEYAITYISTYTGKPVQQEFPREFLAHKEANILRNLGYAVTVAPLEATWKTKH